MSESEVPFEHPWREAALGDVADVIVGGTPSTTESLYWGGSVPWMVSGDVNLKKVDDVPGRISNLGLRFSNAKLVEPPTVAVGLAGQGKTRGTAALVRCRLCTNQSIALLKAKPLKLDVAYLYHNLDFRYDELRSRSMGGGRAGLSKQILEQLPLPLPNLPEQAQIAAILTTIDRAIEETEALIAKQQQIKAGLIQDLLTRGIDEQGNVRNLHTHPFRSSAIGQIPEEWRVVPMARVFDMRLGKMLSKASVTGKSPFPYLANRNVQWDYVDLTDLQEMDFSQQEMVKYSLIAGDLVVCEGGEVGRTALWRGEMENCFFQKAIHRLRARDRSVVPAYVLRYMRYAANRGLLQDFTTQTSIAHLTGEKLATVPLVLPSAHEQQRIAQCIDAVDEGINIEIYYHDGLKKVKTGLMQDLLTGRVRVTELLAANNGEPTAHALPH